ncbi:actin cytoskeleton-regulatory complex protein pan1-like, partial [Denticeps clupeoides]|uniref:actin cytoskeleton-regulatory complex protein pan1-like n=1 Tax=Denticeps clupeoides TaxID=299321 RepID=UPI0010A58322
MSVSSLPEWKQLLLERKRREEEERERREKEEEERLASMPAWKRGIIQRRKAKQEGAGEKDREGGLHGVDDGLAENLSPGPPGGEPTLRLEAERPRFTTDPLKKYSRVSTETIGPICQNPFMRFQCGWRRGKEVEKGGEGGLEKGDEQENEGGVHRGRDIAPKDERYRDRRDSCRESAKEKEWEREAARARKADKDAENLYPGLRTIRADNIIIIEKDRKDHEREENRQRGGERENEERQEVGEKRGMRMDLKEILASRGSVTEIRATEVLIIKPGTDDRITASSKEGEEKQGHERRSSRESTFESGWDKEKDGGWGMGDPEKKRDVVGVKESGVPPRTQGIGHKAEKECSSGGGGRVSQLLSKFGEHPKPPSRSKSIDCFVRLGRGRASFGDSDDLCGRRAAREEEVMARGVPKRSFSFSDRVISGRKNGQLEEGENERRVIERTYSERRVPTRPRLTGDEPERDNKPKVLQRWRYEEKQAAKQEKPTEVEMTVGRELEDDVEASETSEPHGGGYAGWIMKVEPDEGFTMASIKSIEGIAFARRVHIRQEAREKSIEVETTQYREEDRETDQAERVAEVGHEMDELSERDINRDRVIQWERQIQVRIEETKETSCPSRRLSSSGLPSSQSVFSKNTEELICKTGQRREQAMQQELWRATQACMYVDADVTRDTDVEENSEAQHIEGESEGMMHTHHDSHPERNREEHPVIPKSPKHSAWSGQSLAEGDVHIPRNVFYGVDYSSERTSEATGGVERRESWRAGRPLTRIESLRERIRQREMERQRCSNPDGDEGERGESEGKDDEKEEGRRRRRKDEEDKWAAAVMDRELRAERDRRQEEPAHLTDVTQEATTSSLSPQLPVPLSVSQSPSVDEEDRASAVAAAFSGLRTIDRDEEEPKQHVARRRPLLTDRSPGGGGEDKEGDKLAEEAYLAPSSRSPSPASSPSSSPPLPLSLAAMSRIYNLKTVGLRTAVCIGDRVQPFHQVASKETSTTGTQGETQERPWPAEPLSEKVSRAEEAFVQRQVEQLQLGDQEVPWPPHADREAEHSTQKPDLQREKEGARGHHPQARGVQVKEQTTPAGPRGPPSQLRFPKSQPKQNQAKSFTVSPRSGLLPPGPKKHLDRGVPPAPAPSPSSPPPSHSPSPSPPLFSIRSASSVAGKRGTTITITPKKAAGASAPASGPARVQAPAGAAPGEGGKKRYPTAEEIEVIGGYQRLEKSCLLKNRGAAHRGVKVCFDETRLERVCEYPSESSLLAFLPCSPLLGAESGGEERAQGQEDEEDEEEEEEEKGRFVSGAGN